MKVRPVFDTLRHMPYLLNNASTLLRLLIVLCLRQTLVCFAQGFEGFLSSKDALRKRARAFKVEDRAFSLSSKTFPAASAVHCVLCGPLMCGAMVVCTSKMSLTHAGVCICQTAEHEVNVMDMGMDGAPAPGRGKAGYATKVLPSLLPVLVAPLSGALPHLIHGKRD